ncbi:S8 family serine peptidase [Streptomyces sp. NPDC090088]|uniref:S8 family serine peptidase n=1 Tax=Streptomyces sp. NPDC090088 TaxID=3365944 RepID=UPI00380586C1
MTAAALLGMAGPATAVVRTTAALAAAGSAGGQAGPTTHVTLITGDTVRVGPDGRILGVTRAEGRAHIRYMTRVVAGHTSVIPSDAVKLLDSGRLDRRLFDITQLVADGYDDAHRKQVPLIVSYRGTVRQQAVTKDGLHTANIHVLRQLPAVRGQSLAVDKKAAETAWRALTDPDRRAAGAVAAAPAVNRVWLDARVEALPRPTAAAPSDDGAGTAQMGAPDAWRAGLDGKGVKVAVLDTGVDTTHPDLKDAVVASANFAGTRTTDDMFGHGTHVASSIAGSGAASGGKYKGVAPGAQLLNAKVLDDDGYGSDSGIVAGMQWAVDQGAKVINMSLGQRDVYGTDPLEQAVDELSAAKGVLFAISAGNDGPGEGTLASPGSADAAITVAAVDHDDSLGSFSSRGPTADDGLKPDISAPGVNIVGAKAKNAVIGTDAGTPGYITLSGTSMASPHVAGAAAILAQQHPDWTGERIKAALMASAKPRSGPTAYEQGSGRVDLTRGITQNVVTEPASLAFGTQEWPHDDDTPVTKTLTYRNSGSAPVTLHLTAEGAPGVFTVTPSDLTVPAGGTATATVTADTRTGTTDGVYSGAVTAASDDGKNMVRTPGLVTREVESYNLTVKTIGRSGGKPEYATSSLDSMSSSSKYWYPFDRDTDGDYQVTIRVPKGRYVMDDWITEADRSSMLVAPGLSITKDTTVVFDVRKAKGATVTTPVPGAAPRNPIVKYAANGSGFGIAVAVDGGITTAQVGPSAPADEFAAQYSGVWSAGGGAEPQYDVVVTRKGSFFTGLTRTVRQSSMARIETAIGSDVKNGKAEPSGQWETPGFPQLTQAGPGTLGYTRPVPTPRAVTYVSTDQGLRWSLGQRIYRGSEPSPYREITPVAATRYATGRTYHETYNKAVFGPAVADGPNWIGGKRLGNTYALCNSLLSDGHYVFDVAASEKTVLTAGRTTYLSTTVDPCFTGVLSGLPAEKTKYTLAMQSQRSLSTYSVSDRVTATWTFTSAYVDPDGPAQALPLSAVRFTPALTLTGTAQAGRRTTVPVVVQGPAAARGHLKSLAVQVSYDGGRNWRTVAVRTDASGKRSITLTHPARPGTVSFRAALADTAGNTYTGTVDNAYRTVR